MGLYGDIRLGCLAFRDIAPNHGESNVRTKWKMKWVIGILADIMVLDILYDDGKGYL